MTSAASPVSARDLAGLLREVHRRSTALPEDERQRAVELVLAFHLRGRGSQAAAEAVREIYRELGGGCERSPGPAPATSGRRLSPEAERALETIVAGLLGRGEATRAASIEEALPRAERELQRVGEGLAAARPTLTASAPLGERVEELRDRLSEADRALERTAQEFLDRLLDAFDPEAAKAYVGQKGIKLSSFYKASVYDALCEKFSQLRAYHEKGRLVRDFRATFKKYLQLRNTTERGNP